MKKYFLVKYLPILVVLNSCKFTYYLDGEKYIHGIINSCIADSTSFFNSSIITIELKHKENNSNCPNRPKFRWAYDDWPSDLSFYFDKKRLGYGAVTSPSAMRNEYQAAVRNFSSMNSQWSRSNSRLLWYSNLILMWSILTMSDKIHFKMI